MNFDKITRLFLNLVDCAPKTTAILRAVILSVISAFMVGGIIMGVSSSTPEKIEKLYPYFYGNKDNIVF